VAKILVVDDSPTNRSFLVTLLGYGGHALREASDGAEALDLVSTEHPDLVITDILMPTMDGYEFVRRLRSVPEIAQTPVIFCTAHFHERDAKDLARECGVSQVLTKPCEPETVLQTVEDCLQAKSGTPVSTVDESFDREHLRLLTDKLTRQTSELTFANLRLQALLDMSLQLASEGDPSRLLERFCTAARDLIPARYALVAIPSDDNKSVTHMSVAGVEQAKSAISLPLDHEILRMVMETRRPMALRNPGGDPIALRLPPSFRAFDSILVAPIVSPSRAYGWLCLFHRLAATEFSEDDERLASILSALVGRVYENGRLYFAERRHAAELELEIANRRKAEEASTQLAAIVYSSDDAIIGTTLDGNISSWNQGAMRIFGYAVEEVQGRPISFLFGSQSVGELDDALKIVQEGGSVGRFEAAGIKRDGPIEIAVTLSPVFRADGALWGASAIIRDVTAQRRLQQQLLVSQKMEAVGRLSAGIAHDFNNLLTVISGYGSLLLARRNDNDSEYPEVLEITKAADRAASLTRQLLAFSKRRTIQAQTVDLNAVVGDMDRMLRRVIGEDIDLVVALDPSLGLIKADVAQLEQIIMNLVVNARDAMPHGGKLTIHTANIDVPDAMPARNSAVSPGDVMFEITDTGFGMDSETQARIFEPFFTTKDPSRATGLGLSTVYGIVQQSGGAIVVYSEPGRGTTFKIYLPRTGEAASTIQPVAPPVSTRGSETVLVVEDEDSVRMVVSTALKQQGYHVLDARNAGEALIICEEHEHRIDLMISDITMPGMTGPELIERAISIRPDLKVLLMSGYTEKAIIHQLVIADVPFIDKPFSPQILVQKVREVLDVRGK
jgi:two-component system, cell cycle sensor histidine kinase and response regulator CckA